MSKPENAIQNWKKERRSERERLRKKSNQLKDEIKGNPKMVEAIRKLEERIELLEEKID